MCDDMQQTLQWMSNALEAAIARAEAAEKRLQNVIEKLTQAQTQGGQYREEALKYYGQLAEAQERIAELERALKGSKELIDLYRRGQGYMDDVPRGQLAWGEEAKDGQS